MKIGFLILNAYLQCVSYDSFHTVTPCHSGWVETCGKQQAAGCGHQCDGQTSLGRIQIFTQTVISARYQLTQGIGALAEKLREDFCLLLTLELTSHVTCSYRLHGLPGSHLQDKAISQDALRVNGSEALLPRFRFSLEKSKKKNLIKHGGGVYPQPQVKVLAHQGCSSLYPIFVPLLFVTFMVSITRRAPSESRTLLSPIPSPCLGFLVCQDNIQVGIQKMYQETYQEEVHLRVSILVLNSLSRCQGWCVSWVWCLTQPWEPTA